jgi:hypothetical protein
MATKLLSRLSQVRAAVVANPDTNLPNDVRTLRQVRVCA